MATTGQKAGRLIKARLIKAPGGVTAAYAVVLLLVVVSALLAFALNVAPPEAAEAPSAAAAEPEAPPRPSGTLKLPPKPEPAPFRALAPAELTGMIDVTSEGLRLPRIAPDGWMPWIAHSRRFDPAGPPARIGLLVMNVGADEPLMQRAIDDLPGEVSLAFLPGTPDLPRWLGRARQRGHETYLMLPLEDPSGPVERGLKTIETSADTAENLRRLRAAMTRGDGYVGFVVRSPGPVPQSEATLRPLIKEIADRGLAVVEVNPTSDTAILHRLTAELGAGYARSASILDYKLAGDGVAGSLDRMVAWIGESTPGQTPRHAFGVAQPDSETIDAIVAWHKRSALPKTVSFVPIIGHFECREACMTRVNAQPAQLRP